MRSPPEISIIQQTHSLNSKQIPFRQKLRQMGCGIQTRKHLFLQGIQSQYAKLYAKSYFLMNSEEQSIEQQIKQQQCLPITPIGTEQSVQLPKTIIKKTNHIQKKDSDWLSYFADVNSKNNTKRNYDLRQSKERTLEYDLYSLPKPKPPKKQIAPIRRFSREERLDIFISRMADYIVTVIYPDYLKQANLNIPASHLQHQSILFKEN